MQLGDHMEGFERERAFCEIVSSICTFQPELDSKQILSALASIAPSLTNGLFQRRNCSRRLRYIGRAWCPEVPAVEDRLFKGGQICHATSFDGATYSIDGVEDLLVGSAYFEWLKDEAGNGAKEQFDRLLVSIELAAIELPSAGDSLERSNTSELIRNFQIAQIPVKPVMDGISWISYQDREWPAVFRKWSYFC